MATNDYVIRILLEAHDNASSKIRALQMEVAKLRASAAGHDVSDFARGMDDLGRGADTARVKEQQLTAEHQRGRTESDRYAASVARQAAAHRSAGKGAEDHSRSIAETTAAYNRFTDAIARGEVKRAEARRGLAQFGNEFRSFARAAGAGTADAERFGRVADQAVRRSRESMPEAERFTNALGRAFRDLGDESSRTGTHFRNVDNVLRSVANRFDDWSIRFASFSAQLRGLMVAGLIFFFQQINTAIVGLVGSLVSVGSAAAYAGAAIGGAFVAGIAQSIPVIGIFIAAIQRLSAVMQASKVAQQLQQEQFTKGPQAARQQASATDAVANAQDGLKNAYRSLEDAQKRVTTSQNSLTQTRREARRQIIDLGLAEQEAALKARGASLSLAEAQRNLQTVVRTGQGDLDQARLQVSEAQLGQRRAQVDQPRAREDASRARRQGVEGAPQVVSARQQIVQAQQEVARAEEGIVKAQRAIGAAARQAQGADAQFSSAQAQLNFLLAKMSEPEKRLFNAIQRIRGLFQDPRGPLRGISDAIVSPFASAAGRVDKLLRSPAFLKPLQNLSSVIGTQLKRLSDSFLGTEGIRFFGEMAGEAAKNAPLLGDIAVSLSRIFQAIARAASPALHRLLTDLDRFLQRLADSSSSQKGLQSLTNFFDKSVTYAESFGRLGIAIARLFGAIAQAASGSGKNAIDSLTGAINKATTWVQSHGPQVRKFFDDCNLVLKTLAVLVFEIAKAMVALFNPGALKSLVQFLTQIMMPAFVDMLKVLGFIVQAVLDFANAIPGGRKILELVAAVGVLGAVFGKLYSPIAAAFGAVGRLAGAIKALALGEGFMAAWDILRGKVNATTVAIEREKIVAGTPTPVAGPVAAGKTKTPGGVILPAGVKAGGAAGAGAAGAEASGGLAALGSSAAAAGPVIAIVAAAVAGLAAAFVALKTNFLGVRDLFVSVGRFIAQQFTAAWRNLAATIDSVAGKGTVKTVLRAIGDALNFVWKIIKGISPDVVKFVGVAVLGSIASALAPIIIAITAFAVTLRGLSIAIRFIVGLIRSLVRAVPGIGRAFGSAVGAVGRFLGRLPRIVSGAFDDVFTFMRKLPKRLGDLAVDAARAIANGFKNTGGWILDKIKQGFTDVAGFGKGLINWILKQVSHAINSADIPGLPAIHLRMQQGGAVPGYGGGDIIRALVEPGEHVLTKEEVSSAGGHNAILSFRRSLGGGTQATGRRYQQGGAVRSQESEKRGSEAFDIKGEVDLDQANKVGKAIIDGILKGIKDSTKSLIAGFLKTMGDTFNSVMKWLGMKDADQPSKKYRDVGGQIIEGIRVGVVNNTKRLTDSMAATMSNLRRTVDAGLKGVIDDTNKALKPLGVPEIKFSLGEEKAAEGTMASARPGGKVIRVAEGGYDEVVLTTDPSKSHRQQHLLGEYLQRAPHVARDMDVPGFASGGWTFEKLQGLWTKAGGNPSSAKVAAAVALAESSGDPQNVGDGGDSLGLWQVNTPAHPQYSRSQLFDPLGNAKAAVAISGNGKNWSPWTMFNNGGYQKFMGGGGPQDPGVTGGGTAEHIKNLLLKGSEGALKKFGQKAMDKAVDAANKFIDKKNEEKSATSGAGAGSSSGPRIQLPAGSLSVAQLKNLDGVVDVGWSGGPLAAWIGYLYRFAKQHGWGGGQGQIGLSGYRTAAGQRIAARDYSGSNPNASHHMGTKYPGGAIDLPDGARQSLLNILNRSPYAGLLKHPYSHTGQDIVHLSSDIPWGGTSWKEGGWIDGVRRMVTGPAGKAARNTSFGGWFKNKFWPNVGNKLWPGRRAPTFEGGTSGNISGSATTGGFSLYSGYQQGAMQNDDVSMSVLLKELAHTQQTPAVIRKDSDVGGDRAFAVAYSQHIDSLLPEPYRYKFRQGNNDMSGGTDTWNKWGKKYIFASQFGMKDYPPLISGTDRSTSGTTAAAKQEKMSWAALGKQFQTVPELKGSATNFKGWFENRFGLSPGRSPGLFGGFGGGAEAVYQGAQTWVKAMLDAFRGKAAPKAATTPAAATTGGRGTPAAGLPTTHPRHGPVDYGSLLDNQKVSTGTIWSGKASWDDGTGTGTGLQRGISTHLSDASKGWWLVKAPNGRMAITQQVDSGPAGWTKRLWDIRPNGGSGGAMGWLGYNTGNFPTDRGSWSGEFLGGSLPRGIREGRFTGNPGFAKGGVVPGAEGEPYEVTVHGGEIVLNSMHQAMLGGARRLRDFLGFGPGSRSDEYQDGGIINYVRRRRQDRTHRQQKPPPVITPDIYEDPKGGYGWQGAFGAGDAGQAIGKLQRVMDGVIKTLSGAGRPSTLKKVKDLGTAITGMLDGLTRDGGLLDIFKVGFENFVKTLDTQLKGSIFQVDKHGNAIRRMNPIQIIQREMGNLQRELTYLTGERGVIVSSINAANAALKEARRRKDKPATQAAIKQINALETRLGDFDAQLAEAYQALGAKQEELLTSQVSLANELAQNQLNAAQRTTRMADVAQKAGAPEFAAFSRGIGLQQQGEALGAQRNNLYGLLAQAQHIGAEDQIRSLTDQIEDLSVQLAENTQAFKDNITAFRQVQIDIIAGRGQFQGGVYTGLQGILETIGQLTGAPDIQAMLGLGRQNQNVLQQTGAGLTGQLAGGFGVDLQGLSGQKLISGIAGLNFDAIERGMSEANKVQFESLIKAIIDNENALQSNTNKIAELSGQMQQFTVTTSAFQMFRASVFTGMGGLLPQYAKIPLLASGGDIMQSGLAFLHAGERVKPATVDRTKNGGDEYNLNLTSPTEVADPNNLARQFAFAMKHKR